MRKHSLLYDDLIKVTKLDDDPFEFLEDMLDTFMSGAVNAKMNLSKNKAINA